jgi:hypothetical protein
MRFWTAFWVINWLFFIGLIIEALIVEPTYNPIGVIQNFGIGNMFLAIMVFMDAQVKQVEKLLKVLVWLGIFAALFGVVQRLLGPSLFAAIGIDIFDPYTFAFLDSSNMETGHRDIENGFRAFSFFASHHSFSAFLILSTLSLQILMYQKRIGAIFYSLAMIIMFSGFVVSFNLTNMFSCIIIIILFAIFQYAKKINLLFKLLLNKSVWRNVIIAVFFGICAISTYEPLRNRLIGIFDISSSNAGAGGSLNTRINYFLNGVEALSENPFGLGLILNQNSDQKSTLSGFSRRDYFSEHHLAFSGDSWFLFLTVQIGFFFGILYFLLFLIPIYYGITLKNAIYDTNLIIIFRGITALLIIVFIGGISNSPILVYPPSNLFIWAAVGVLLKIPTWDRELYAEKLIKNA